MILTKDELAQAGMVRKSLAASSDRGHVELEVLPRARRHATFDSAQLLHRRRDRNPLYRILRNGRCAVPAIRAPQRHWLRQHHLAYRGVTTGVCQRGPRLADVGDAQRARVPGCMTMPT